MVNVANYVLSLPLILLALFAVGSLVMDRMFPPEWKWMNGITALVGVAFAAGGVAKVQVTQTQLELSRVHLQVAFGHAMVVDDFAIFFYYLLLGAGLLALLIAIRRAPAEQAPRGAFYAALLACIVGLMCMVSGFHLGLIFAGVAVSEAAGYALVRIQSCEEPARSAARRYLRWKVFSSAVLGLGFLLLRIHTGSAGLHEIRQATAGLISGQMNNGHYTLAAAFTLTVVGLILKIAAVPFHQWNQIPPDADGQGSASQSAQSCVTGFLSTAFPVAAWAMALHVFLWGLYPLRLNYTPWLIWAAVLLLIVGTLAILMQSDLRRFVAYAALPAAGVMLLALAVVASSDLFNAAVAGGLKAIQAYLLAIVFMNLGMLALIPLLREKGIGTELTELGGLFRRVPLQASLLVVFVISIVGLPPLAGFYGKYLAYLSLTGSDHRKLAVFGLVCIALGAVWLVRILKAMLSRGAAAPKRGPGFYGAWTAALLCAAFVVVMGVHPQFLIRLASWSLHLN